MHGQAPNAIITDQDQAMQNAIQITLPNMKQMVPVAHYEKVARKVWIPRLYENRGQWVPGFLKTTFWAGMSTTQRSESMNAFFNGYVHSKISLKQFVKQYERAFRNKVEKEFQADFRSYSQLVPCATTYEMEKQFQAIYTIEKFKEVQQEFTEKVYCDVVSKNANDYYWSTYEVHEDVVLHEHRKKKSFCVSFRRDTCELICRCHLFEFWGIICRHVIAILIRNDITSMPERYILRRWRRDVSRAHSRIAVHYDGLVSIPGQLRYDEMCQIFSEVADLATDDEVWTRTITEWMTSQIKELRKSKSSFGSVVYSQPNSNGGHILDPVTSNRKGAPKKLRRKGPLECSLKRTK
ncbi:protein FAR-RED IMPAIRED RESPONSE 1-like, partial [Olea europaea var. sylvestris]|uniref:protein FAR-RED IMPAIRED RESPONSE 1-like n=1 Tax=Olea europaea var. sylvestris TaxID=158386 RepID=UPI000C1D3083